MRHLFSLLMLGGALPVTAQRLPADTVAAYHNVLGADCAIFPAAAALPPVLLDNPDNIRIDRFTPTLAQVTQAEQALRRQKLGQAAPRPESDYYAHYPALIEKNLARYRRQYFGYYNDERHPCVYINAFSENYMDIPGSIPYWLRTPVWAFDGGTSYWAICYDFTVQKFYCFSHNSEG
jgi:hypothetical protein